MINKQTKPKLTNIGSDFVHLDLRTGLARNYSATLQFEGFPSRSELQKMLKSWEKNQESNQTTTRQFPEITPEKYSITDDIEIIKFKSDMKIAETMYKAVCTENEDLHRVNKQLRKMVKIMQEDTQTSLSNVENVIYANVQNADIIIIIKRETYIKF